MIVILAVFLAFLIPVLFFVWKELRTSKSGGKKIVAVKRSAPISVSRAVKAAATLLIIISPVFFLSNETFYFYPAGTAELKIAFKRAGKKVVDCDEAGEIKRAGERYRASMKEGGKDRGVKMSLQTLASCPRERHPLMVSLRIDGKETLKKTYPPTGLKKDMASYVYEEIYITPGERAIEAYLYDGGRTKGVIPPKGVPPPDTPDFAVKKTVLVRPGEIKLIRFDDVENALVLE